MKTYNFSDETLKHVTKILSEYSNLDTIYKLACNDNGNSIEFFQDIIISGNELEYIYLFARDVKGADIQKLQSKLIELSLYLMNIEYLYLFARDVPGADKKALEEAIYESAPCFDETDVEYEDKYIDDEKFIKDHNLFLCADYLVYLFASEIEGADIIRLEQLLQRPYYEYVFARDVPGADILQLENRVCSSWDDDVKLLFAKNIPSANLDKIAKSLEEPKEIYEFAMAFPETDIVVLEQKIIDCMNEGMEEYDYLLKLAQNAKGFDFDLLSRALYEKCNSLLKLTRFVRNLDGLNMPLIEKTALSLIHGFDSAEVYEFVSANDKININLFIDYAKKVLSEKNLLTYVSNKNYHDYIDDYQYLLDNLIILKKSRMESKKKKKTL